MINFNLDTYTSLIALISKNYQIHNFTQTLRLANKPFDVKGICCLRHDVDYCVYNAYEMAVLENQLNIISSYFFLLDNDNYNLLSKQSRAKVCQIAQMGHEIALHFDVANYEPAHYAKTIKLQKDCLEDITGKEITSISYHNPGIVGLNNLSLDDEFFGLNNTYSSNFNKSFTYISDSFCRFKNPNILQSIQAQEYSNIHLLIHPIWWLETADARDQKIIDNIYRQKLRRLDEYNDLLTKYGVSA